VVDGACSLAAGRYGEAPMVSPIVEFIAREPGLADRVLLVHADDGIGRCRVCSGGAQAAGGTPFPARSTVTPVAAREAADRRKRSS
jgi:hypothetical protein